MWVTRHLFLNYTSSFLHPFRLLCGGLCFFLMRCLHLTRSCTSFPDSSLSDKSFLMLSNHLCFGLPLLLFPGTSITISLAHIFSSWLHTQTVECHYTHERNIKDKNGVILTSEEDQMGRWRDHFEELLNRPAPSNPPDIPLASEVLEVNCERPDREEIRKAISLLKTDKAPGPDEIPAEAIKADMETSTEMLHDLIGKIWDTDEIPIGWKEGYLVKIPKKGDLQ